MQHIFDYMRFATVNLSRKSKNPDSLTLLFTGRWSHCKGALAEILPTDLAESLDSGRPHEFGVGQLRFGIRHDGEPLLALSRWGKVQVTVVPGESVRVKVLYEAHRHREAMLDLGIVRPRDPSTDGKHKDIGALTPNEWRAIGEAAGRECLLILDREPDKQQTLDLDAKVKAST